MEISNVSMKNKEEEVETDESTVDNILAKLEKVKDPVGDVYRYRYQGFWIREFSIKGLISLQTRFVARNEDILLASCPKSGTTWLKSLVFTIMKRTDFDFKPRTNDNNNSPLFTTNPHQLIPLLELSLPIENMKPRIMNTHIPYSSLPPSIKHSDCKIVYICRNPLDVFVSHWHFSHKFFGDKIEPRHLEESFDMFCKGIHAFGPFWDHVLGFWNASLEMPHKILFLKYEDLKRDNVFFIKKIAEFLGFPFSVEEENQGVPKEIERLCSLEHLKSLSVNKTGKYSIGLFELSNSSFFRKGEMGDWMNYLTPQMAERGKKLIQEKFGQSGLMFNF
ncbi:cytosolic sulfotransferase 15-like [Humulus lupulus]|uniref:cytosolic sulfotransferase 15-like n=1 Tax=Humulus lupulus TaxID=3486 RepID=UPI002B416912|nr:cytosolic sulfotransferase 15-like [Humulus lupulus]